MANFGTGPMHSTGIGRPKDDEIEFEAQAHEPSGRALSFACKIRLLDRDHHTYEMWRTDPGGRRFRTILVEYTRS